MSNWQPMESAPKDGTQFLYSHETHDGREIAICDWFEIQRGQWNRTGGIWQPLPAPPSREEGEKVDDRVHWRGEVIQMANFMERKLRKNDHKGGWMHDTPESLLARLREEVAELEDEVRKRREKGRTEPGPVIYEEAADVCNMAMMVAMTAIQLPATTPLHSAGSEHE